MGLEIRKVQAWSGELPDRPGAAAATLERLARAGADLAFVFTRPHPTRPETSTLILAPIVGGEQTRAACAAGLAPAANVALLRVVGQDRGGLGYELMASLAVAGINLRGLAVSTVDGRFAAYLAFDNPDVAAMALQVLATLV